MTILLIDDDQAVRESLAETLQADGFQVDSAENGAEGLRLLKERAPALVLLDLAMPYMSGAAFRAVQRRLPAPLSAIPVVVISGVDTAEADCEQMGVMARLAKPFTQTTLLATVRALCA